MLTEKDMDVGRINGTANAHIHINLEYNNEEELYFAFTSFIESG